MRTISPTPSNRDFPRRALSAAIALLAAASMPALSQEQGVAELEEIEVLGIRRSFSEGLDKKRYSDTFTDAIVAEDIGKLPDDNLAETLQRVAGVQIEREDGEGAGITIRGIRKNRVEVNGRTLISPYGRGGNAGLMSYFPSGMSSSVSVSKVLTADMTDGALGGTVNVTTRKPLARRGFWGNANIKSSYADLNGDTGLKGSGLVSNTFAGDTMGLLLGAVYEDRSITQDKFFSNGDWRQGAPGVEGYADPYYYQYDLRFQRKEEERTKSAINAAFQWQVNDSLDINVDFLRASYDYDRSRGWMGVILDKTLDNYDPDSIVVDERDARVAGSLNTKIENNHEGYQAPQHFMTGGINANWVAGNGVSVFVEYGYTDSERTGDQQYIQLYTRGADDGGVPIDFDIRGTDIPNIEVPELTDPSIFTAATFYDERNVNSAREDSFRVDIDIPMDGVITGIKTGMRYSGISADATKYAKMGAGSYSNARVSSFTRAGIEKPHTITGFDFLMDALVSYELGDVLSGTGVQLPGEIVVVDTDKIGNGGYGFSDAFYEGAFVRLPDYTYTVEDTITALYARADFEVAGWEGNLGLRYADTTTKVESFALVDGGYQPYSDEGNYADLIPSIVVKRDLSDELVLRLGASETINRPATDTLGATGRVNLIIDNPDTPEDESEGSTAALPNPGLEPERGVQADAALEWYFAEHSTFAVGLFYKELDQQILNVTEPGNIPGYGDQVFNISTQINGLGGRIKGIELAYQQDFSFLPGFWGNTGAAVNYTYLQNSTDEVDPRTGEPMGIQGVSENSANIQLYYEDNRISSRLLYNWRDDYFDRLGYAGATAIYNKGQPSLDASLRYRLGSGYTLELQAVNLLDNPEETYAGWEDYVATYAETGRRYKLSVSKRF